MTKNCVIQFNIDIDEDPKGEDDRFFRFKYQKIDCIDTMLEYSKILAMEYARQCDADYHLVTTHWLDDEKRARYHPGMSKLALFLDNKWIDQYDNILYLDTDTYTWPWAPNIFELCPDDAFSVVNYGKRIRKFANRTRTSIESITVDPELYDRFSFNAGVLVVNRYIFDWMNDMFTKHPRWMDYNHDQHVFNDLCNTKGSNIKMNMLDTKFNAKAKYGVHKIKGHYISHMWGPEKYRNNNRLCIEYNEYAEPYVKKASENLLKSIVHARYE